MRKISSAALLVLASTAAFAQAPAITAVVDAGGYTASLAQGSVFVVKGTNLCGSAAVATTPYSTDAMGGATIQLTPVGGGAAIKAYMIYCYNANGTTQLAAELPSDAAAGDYNVTVSASGTSAPFKTTVVAHKFQIMTQPGSGSGRALLQNVVTPTQYDLNGFTGGPVAGATFARSPAKPSEVLIAWGTGLGPAPGFDSTPPGALDFQAQGLDVKAVVGGVEITPSYAGRSNLFPGLDNIAFQLPADVPTGCSVPFEVRVAGQLSNLTTIAIAPNGQAAACESQISSDALTKLDSGGTITAGFFNLTSFTTQAARVEGASGTFAKFNADTITQLPDLSAASSGSCQVYQSTSTAAPDGGGLVNSNLTFLDAGNITLSGPNVSNKAFTKTNNVYTLNLGANSSPLITPGTYTLAGAGGADIGTFSAAVNVTQAVTITGGLPSTVNRNQGLQLAWTGGGSGLVLIAGTSAALIGGTSTNGTFNTGTFICATTADKQSFTVPSSVLLQLPATPAGAGVGALAVYTMSTPAANNGLFSAPLTGGGSTDFAIFTAGIGNSATPVYQ